MTRLFCSVLVVSTLLSIIVSAQTDSGFVLFDVSHPESNYHRTGLCANFQQFFVKSLRTSAEEAPVYDLNWWLEKPNLLDVCVEKDHDLGGEIIPLTYITKTPHEYVNCSLRSNETYYVQAQMNQLRNAGAAAALFILEKGIKSDFHGRNYLFSRFYNPKVTNDTPAFYIYKHQFDDFKNLINVDENHAPSLRFYRPADPFLDAGVFVLLFLAVGCIWIGSLWYTCDLRRRLELGDLSLKSGVSENTAITSAIADNEETSPPPSRTQSPSQIEEGTQHEQRLVADSTQTDDKEVLCCSPNGACVHLFYTLLAFGIVVTVLLLSFFYRPIAVEFFNVFLVIGGTLAMCKCVLSLSRAFVTDPSLGAPADWFGIDVGRRQQRWYLPACLYESFRPVGFLILLAALAFALCWYIAKDELHAFYMLDFMNACICIYSVRSSEVRSLRFITFFLTAMFVYDIVMVFGTRLVTESGCSVMVQVVTGMDCTKFRPIDFSNDWPVAPIVKGLADRPRKIPLLFYVPMLSNPVGHCVDPIVEGEYQHIMLGLGDVIAPGYLIAFAFYLDVRKRNKFFIYGYTTLIGYALGMISTFISLKLMETAQPALIYLVPFTLIPLTLLCLVKGTLREAWKGLAD